MHFILRTVKSTLLKRISSAELSYLFLETMGAVGTLLGSNGESLGSQLPFSKSLLSESLLPESELSFGGSFESRTVLGVSNLSEELFLSNRLLKLQCGVKWMLRESFGPAEVMLIIAFNPALQSYLLSLGISVEGISQKPKDDSARTLKRLHVWVLFPF